MSLKRYLQKLRYIDHLIGKKATGNQRILADKMQLSRSGLNKLLNEMKEIGFPIKYDHMRQTYYYENEGRMVESLFKEELSIHEMEKLTGGRIRTMYEHDHSFTAIHSRQADLH